MGKIPRKKRLVGHAKRYDVYQTRGGQIYLYSGSKKGDWDNPKKWKKVRK